MRQLATLLLLLSAVTTRAQHTFVIEAGAGMPVFNLLSKNNNVTTRAFITPAVEVNYTYALNKWVNIGGKLAYQRYSFDFSYNKLTSAGAQMDGVHTKSNYLFLAPTLDIGIGKKQAVHAYLSPAAGYLLSGTQTTEDLLQYGSLQTGNIYRSDDKIEKLLFRLNIGLEECVWKNANWQVVINEGLSVVSTPVTTLPTSKTQVRPGYVYVQVGIAKRHAKTKTAGAPK